MERAGSDFVKTDPAYVQLQIKGVVMKRFVSLDSEDAIEDDEGDSRYFWGSLNLSTSF